MEKSLCAFLQYAMIRIELSNTNFKHEMCKNMYEIVPLLQTEFFLVIEAALCEQGETILFLYLTAAYYAAK